VKDRPIKLRCQGRIYGPYPLGESQCPNIGRFNESGKAWCGYHAPSKLQAKFEARMEKLLANATKEPAK